METKKCPHCGAEIEENARFCLYCMTSLDQKEAVLPRIFAFKRWILLCILGLLILIGGILLIVGLSRKEQPKESPMAEPDLFVGETQEPSAETLPGEPMDTESDVQGGEENDVTEDDSLPEDKGEFDEGGNSTEPNEEKQNDTETSLQPGQSAPPSSSIVTEEENPEARPEAEPEVQTKPEADKGEQEKPETDKTEQTTPVTKPETNKTEQTTPVTKPETDKTEQTTPVTKPETDKTEQTTPVIKPETNKTEQTTPVTKPETNKTEQTPPVTKPETDKVEETKPVTTPEPEKEEETKPVTTPETEKEEQTTPVPDPIPEPQPDPEPEPEPEPVVTEAEFTYREAKYGVDDFKITTSVKNCIVITGIKTPASDGIYRIPATIDGKTVLSIEGEGFYKSGYAETMKAVYIPATLRTVKGYAFIGCNNLTDVYLLGKSIFIDSWAFPPSDKRTGTLTIHCSSDCNNRDFRYYKNIAKDYYDAQYDEWNG